MRKSIVALLVVLFMLVPALAACGGTAATPPTAAPAEPTAAAAEPTVAPTDAPMPEPTAAPAEPTVAPTDAPAEGAVDPTTLKVGLVTDTGKVNDGTFNEFAHKGVTDAQTEYGFEYKYIETTASADYATNIQTFVDEEFDVIVTVGFLIADATKAAAAANPEITFIGVDQFHEPGAVTDNIVGIQFREDQAGFLAGALAGMLSESGTIGFVGGIEIPPVKKFKNGYDNGAAYVRPDVNIQSVYIPNFVAPAEGASAAQQMIGEGADVIFGAGGQTGSGAIKAAAEAGIFVIGVDQDEFLTTFGNGSAPGSDKIVSSAIKRVDVAVAAEISKIIAGTFEGNGITVFDAAGDGVGLADFHDAAAAVTPAMQAKLDEILAGLADGSLKTGVDPVSGDVLAAEIPAASPFTP